MARHKAFLLLAIGACCLACGAGTDPEPEPAEPRYPPGFKIENYRWTGTVAEGGLVEARNPYGDFRSRSSPDDTVMVTAQIQRLSPDQPDVEFVIEETEKGLIVAVGRAAFEMAELGDGPNDGFPGRVDLTILIPKHCRLKAQTIDDNIQIDGFGMTNDVEATARDGNVTVVTRGHVRARTGGGRLDVKLGNKSWSRPQALQTATGKIVVEILDIANLAVDAQTSGEIRTQFTQRHSPKVQRTDGALTAVIGNGGSELTIRSDRGIVELNAVERLNAKL